MKIKSKFQGNWPQNSPWQLHARRLSRAHLRWTCDEDVLRWLPLTLVQMAASRAPWHSECMGGGWSNCSSKERFHHSSSGLLSSFLGRNLCIPFSQQLLSQVPHSQNPTAVLMLPKPKLDQEPTNGALLGLSKSANDFLSSPVCASVTQELRLQQWSLSSSSRQNGFCAFVTSTISAFLGVLYT